MPEHSEIYNRNADIYDHLVSSEDYKGNLLKKIKELTSLKKREIVELGAGTGRITGLLAPEAGNIKAFDISEHMLDFARTKMALLKNRNWSFQTADNRNIPLPDNCADISVSGWSIGYFSSWEEPDWEESTIKSVNEMDRVLRKSGIIMIIETLGTGYESPFEPPEALERYFRLLENKLGFSRTWIRTDYKFTSPEDAEKTVRFFFGDDLADRIRESGSSILSECTGIWTRKK